MKLLNIFGKKEEQLVKEEPLIKEDVLYGKRVIYAVKLPFGRSVLIPKGFKFWWDRELVGRSPSVCCSGTGHPPFHQLYIDTKGRLFLKKGLLYHMEVFAEAKNGWHIPNTQYEMPFEALATEPAYLSTAGDVKNHADDNLLIQTLDASCDGDIIADNRRFSHCIGNIITIRSYDNPFLAFCTFGIEFSPKKGKLSIEFVKGLKRIMMPKVVKEWYRLMFRSVEILPPFEHISAYAFADMPIEEVVLPLTLATIGKCAFKNCKNLKSIILGPNVKRIHPTAFEGCDNLVLVLPDRTVAQASAFTGWEK